MNRYPCSGCGLWCCEGECFLEEPEAADEETISTLTLADLCEKYGNPFGTECHGDPLLRKDGSMNPEWHKLAKDRDLSSRIGHDFGDYADLIVRKSKQERGRQPVRDTPLPSDSK